MRRITIHSYWHRYPHLFSPADYTYARWAWACSIIMSRTWVIHRKKERERNTHTYTQTHTAPSCHELGQYTHKEGERLTHLHSDTSGCQSAFLCSVANVLLFPCLFFSDISGFQSLFSFFLLRKHLITKWAGGCVAEWEGCKVVWKIFFIWIFFVLFGCGAERVGCKSWSTLINYSWQKCNQLSLRVDLILTRRVSIYWKRWK